MDSRVARRSYGHIIEENPDSLRIRLRSFSRTYNKQERVFHFRDNQIIIIDQLPHEIMAFANFHLYPSIEAQVEANGVRTSLGRLEFEGAEKIELMAYEYAPEFNRVEKSINIRVQFHQQLKTVISL